MLNRFAYLTTGWAIKMVSGLSRARIQIHNRENIPDGPTIFVINHFTRLETMIMPYHIFRLTNIPVWSLADYTLFKGGLASIFDRIGVVSTRDPHRDRLIVKSLLTGEANWIIFPEGRMVKNKKIFERGRFMVSSGEGAHRPHTGAATLALRTEFYRQRIQSTAHEVETESKRLMDMYGIESVDAVSGKSTCIVPVNITYYPIRARENILSELAARFIEAPSERMMEELMTEGTMLLAGVDIDIRFGTALKVSAFMEKNVIFNDISTRRRFDFDDPIASRSVMREIAVEIMERYMESIYQMTTVNHDHIFSSLLKYIPGKTIEIQDLKNKAYLVATRNFDNVCGCFHSSLNEDQVSLLTDDRYRKFRDFIRLAIDKGIVVQDGSTLIKDNSKFATVSDFHQVRIENPLSVIANEVEPLTCLQNIIKRIAWLPNYMGRLRIRNRLMEKTVEEFETDYTTYYIEGESKGKSIGTPFLLRSRRKQTGVLLIHGYMAAPPEIASLAHYLNQKGYWVYAPRLKGHGTSPEDLAGRTYWDWIKSVDQGYAIIRSVCSRVVVGGFSTGAALSLELASRLSYLKGVFAICPPLRLQDVSSRFAGAVDAWNRFMHMVKIDRATKEFIENTPENPHINYFRNPISGVREIELLMDDVENKLPEIHFPALVAQSYKDPVVNPVGSRRIFELLGSEDKRYVLFNFDRHGILLGKGSEKVHRTIGHFIDELND